MSHRIRRPSRRSLQQARAAAPLLAQLALQLYQVAVGLHHGPLTPFVLLHIVRLALVCRALLRPARTPRLPAHQRRGGQGRERPLPMRRRRCARARRWPRRRRRC